jgi:hypothetical protein
VGQFEFALKDIASELRKNSVWNVFGKGTSSLIPLGR